MKLPGSPPPLYSYIGTRITATSSQLWRTTQLHGPASIALRVGRPLQRRHYILPSRSLKDDNLGPYQILRCASSKSAKTQQPKSFPKPPSKSTSKSPPKPQRASYAVPVAKPTSKSVPTPPKPFTLASPVASTPESTSPASSNELPPPPLTITNLPSYHKLNPPFQTYAPGLNVPPKTSDTGKLMYLWKAGKSYYHFYLEGIKRVWRMRKLAQQIKAMEKKRKAALAPKSASKEASTTKQKSGREHHAIKSVSIPEALTRAEFQILRRSRKSMIQLSLFAPLALVAGEWLALIALWITPLVPDPCRIPVQVKRALEKTQKRRLERERRLGMDSASVVASDQKKGFAVRMLKPGGIGRGVARNGEKIPRIEVKTLGMFDLLALGARFDAYSAWWDRLYVVPPKRLLQNGVRKKLEYLAKDDAMIERDGGWEGLSKEEVEKACVERGIFVLGKSEADLRAELRRWSKGYL